MAIKLLDKPNTEGISYDYPYGNIKDNPGDNSGTPVNKLVYADFHQFFSKIMADAGISYNGHPDNATDGFQYFIAFIKNIKDTIDSYNNQYTDISGSISLHPNLTSSTIVARKYKDDTILLRVNATISSNITALSDLITNIPAGSGGSYITAHFRNTSGGDISSGIVSLSGDKIATNIALNTSTYDRFYLYLIYKAE